MPASAAASLPVATAPRVPRMAWRAGRSNSFRCAQAVVDRQTTPTKALKALNFLLIGLSAGKPLSHILAVECWPGGGLFEAGLPRWGGPPGPQPAPWPASRGRPKYRTLFAKATRASAADQGVRLTGQARPGTRVPQFWLVPDRRIERALQAQERRTCS